MFKKQSTQTTRKLEIKRETLKRMTDTLSENQLKQAAGGVSASCTDARCEDGASVSTAPC